MIDHSAIRTPYTLIAIIALLFFAFRLFLTRSEAWLRIGRPIIDALR